MDKGVKISKVKGKFFVADIETTGLIEDLKKQGNKAKLHNLAILDINSEEKDIQVFHANTANEKAKLQKFLDQDIYLIMHNGVCYDSVALKLLGFDVSRITFIDSFALSLYLYLDRPLHGLESWGIDFGVPKPEVVDWENLTQEDYDHRVVEDVKINYEVYKKQREDFSNLYLENKVMSDEEFFNHKMVRYLTSKFNQLKEQEENKILIDVDLCEKTIKEFEILVEEKNKALVLAMPKVEVVKKVKRPAKPFKKDGTLSATGENWKAIVETAKVSFDFPHHIEVVEGYKEPNPNSPDQLKNWLFSLGWEPCTYKYTKDSDGKGKKIPQVYIPNSGGQVTESVEKLAEIDVGVAQLTGKAVINHRLGVLRGFLSSKNDNNLVVAGASGFTNTLRLKHRKPMVNLPAVNKPYSKTIRGCIMARSGKIFYGADLSGLETILKLNYQIPFDPKFVNEQQREDFDPHLDIAIEAGIVSQAESDFFKIKKEGFPPENYKQSDELKELLMLDSAKVSEKLAEISSKRHVGKQANYSCQYSAGAKAVSRSSGISLAVAKTVVNAYRSKNWSINAIAESQTLVKRNTGTWLKNPLNGMYYYIKAEKDIFSTLVQGSGSFILDLWISFCNKLRVERKIDFKLLATFHDEKIFEIDDTENMKASIKKLSEDALEMVNKLLNLDIPIKFSYDFGYRYSDIH